MFGGVRFLHKRNLLAGVWKDSLFTRLGPDCYDDALLEPHVREFDFTGRPMKGWIMAELEGLKDDDKLKYWIRGSEEFVCALTAK